MAYAHCDGEPENTLMWRITVLHELNLATGPRAIA